MLNYVYCLRCAVLSRSLCFVYNSWNILYIMPTKRYTNVYVLCLTKQRSSYKLVLCTLTQPTEQTNEQTFIHFKIHQFCFETSTLIEFSRFMKTSQMKALRVVSVYAVRIVNDWMH